MGGQFGGQHLFHVCGGRVDLGDPRDLPFTIKTDETPATLGSAAHPGGFILGANMALTRSAVF